MEVDKEIVCCQCHLPTQKDPRTKFWRGCDNRMCGEKQRCHTPSGESAQGDVGMKFWCACGTEKYDICDWWWWKRAWDWRWWWVWRGFLSGCLEYAWSLEAHSFCGIHQTEVKGWCQQLNPLHSQASRLNSAHTALYKNSFCFPRRLLSFIIKQSSQDIYIRIQYPQKYLHCRDIAY